MKDIDTLTKQAFAITGKLNSIVLTILSDPDRDKKRESLFALEKRLSAVSKFVSDYLVATAIINSVKEP